MEPPPVPGRRSPTVLAAVDLGGALGAPARYGMSRLIRVAAHGFPWATFWTNVSGSLALGFVLVLILERFPAARYWRPFVASGFLGAYTTYSTFAVETDLLARAGRLPTALIYDSASLVAGFLAVVAGMWAARALPRRAAHGRTP